MNNDFTWEKIVDWIDGRLSDQEAESLAAQLAAMSDAELMNAAQKDMEWLQAFQKLSGNVPLKHLSDATRQKLMAQFEQLHTSKRLLQPLAMLSRAFRVFIATLTSDSWQTPLIGVRRSVRQGLRHGEGQRDSRQLIYKTDLAEVALNVRTRTREGVLDLRCQLFANTDLDLQTVSAQLVQNARFRQVQLSDLGDFAFSNVLPGEYDLMLAGDDFEIAIPNLTLSL